MQETEPESSDNATKTDIVDVLSLTHTDLNKKVLCAIYRPMIKLVISSSAPGCIFNMEPTLVIDTCIY